MRLLVAGLILALTGCVTPPRVVTDVESYSRLTEADQQRTITVVAASMDASLRFDDIARRLEHRLSAQGFKVVSNPTQAELLAILDFGVGNPRTQVRTYEGRRTTQIYDFASRSYVEVSTPYADVDTYSVHDREISVQIVRNAGEGEVLYEAYLRSSGRCGVLAEVADEMFAAMFQNFPNSSGEIVMPSQANC